MQYPQETSGTGRPACLAVPGREIDMLNRRNALHTTLAISLFLTLGTCARSHADEVPSKAHLGERIGDLSFTDGAGNAVSLGGLKGTHGTVIVFLSFDCPVAQSYAQPLGELVKKFSNFRFVGVVSNPEEDPARLQKQAEEFKLNFPVVKDAEFRAADALGATLTPEVFLLDAANILRYRGRIDDSYYARLKRNPQPVHFDLRDAIEDLQAGKAVRRPATVAVGCPIPRTLSVKTPGGTVTFYRDVLPILQQSCQECHRPGEVGPFALMNYRQAVNWAADIKEFTENRKMPPWKPSEGLPFHNERKLTNEAIATLGAWVENGMPEGDPKEAPPPRTFSNGWRLGQPDLVLSPSEDFQLGAAGSDVFRCFVLPTSLPEDRYVAAIEIRPGNSRIVHHTLQVIDTTGKARALEQENREREKTSDSADRGPGYTVPMGFGFLPQGGVGGWAPGQVPNYLPDGTGYLLPKGADLVVQVHYHRDGRVEKDRLKIGLHFAKKPVQKRYQGLTIPGRFLFIPAGQSRYRVEGRIWVDQDCDVYSVLPHMHKLGKEIKVTLTPPDGKSQTLIAIRDWDYAWQETYFFAQPLKVKGGTRFEVAAVYDNSAANPNNPSQPPKLVRFGQQTTDEMCFVFLGATPEKPGRLRSRPRAPQQPASIGKNSTSNLP